MSQSSIRPLSIGNVVSTAFVLYRSHLKTYLKLALFAALWSLVPVYGWAKASTIAGLISRLAFKELVGQPESVNTARSHLKPRMWDFFVVGLLIGLIIAGTFIVFYVSFFILLLISFGVAQAFKPQNPVSLVILSLVWIIFVLLWLAAFLWLYSRLMVSEVALAIENNIFSTSSISRSWDLTKGLAFLWRLQVIVLLTFTITLPIYIIVQIIVAVFQHFLSTVIAQRSAPFLVISYITAYFLGLLINIGILPIWQCIKAVIYYDLRSRREGMGLQLSNRTTPLDEHPEDSL